MAAAYEEGLTAAIVELASQYGRYGYRRIGALLRRRGWAVNHKRVERIWRQEGLKAPQKQPKRSRLWLNDGSCVRLRPQRRNHVWADDLFSEASRLKTPILPKPAQVTVRCSEVRQTSSDRRLNGAWTRRRSSTLPAVPRYPRRQPKFALHFRDPAGPDRSSGSTPYTVRDLLIGRHCPIAPPFRKITSKSYGSDLLAEISPGPKVDSHGLWWGYGWHQ